MDEATRFPIDFEALQKGDTISGDLIASKYDVDVESPKHAFNMMSLVNEIELRRPDLVAKQSDGDIAILTDPQASAYLSRRGEYHARGIGQTNERLNRVDISQLTEAEQRKHEHSVGLNALRQVALIQAAKKSRSLPKGESPAALE